MRLLLLLLLRSLEYETFLFYIVGLRDTFVIFFLAILAHCPNESTPSYTFVSIHKSYHIHKSYLHTLTNISLRLPYRLNKQSCIHVQVKHSITCTIQHFDTQIHTLLQLHPTYTHKLVLIQWYRNMFVYMFEHVWKTVWKYTLIYKISCTYTFTPHFYVSSGTCYSWHKPAWDCNI